MDKRCKTGYITSFAGRFPRLVHDNRLSTESAGSAISSITQIGSTGELADGEAVGATGNLIANICYLS